MNPEEMLRQATAELESAEAELQAAQRRVDELRTIQQGVQLAMQRYGQAKANVPGPTTQDTPRGAVAATNVAVSSSRRPRRRPTKRSRPEVNQTDLCIEALEEYGRPASATEVRERLKQRGHSYDPEQIRSAFAYLLRRERVVRVDVGVWALPSDHPGAAQNGSRVSNDAGQTH